MCISVKLIKLLMVLKWNYKMVAILGQGSWL
jgi:hypothetical protein